MKLVLIVLIHIVKHAFLKKKEHVKNAKKDIKNIKGNVIN
jgi:hypothetical protein